VRGQHLERAGIRKRRRPDCEGGAPWRHQHRPAE